MELLGLLRKSSLVEEDCLETYLQHLQSQGSLPDNPQRLAGMLVRDGLLTFFQTAQLLLGKWRGFTLGNYKVLEQLGSGGMGNVFLCEHQLMRRRVALKVLPSDLATDPTCISRFRREAQAIAALDHANIVRAHDISHEGNFHFLVMEYVDGVSLHELILKRGPIEPIRAAHYIYQAALGLEHAHEAGLVHRDIKPGNLIVNRAGMVKILDMGLALFFHDPADQQDDHSVVGTADYLAPEQAMSSQNVDIRADIYSLGATFYFLLTGSPPFGSGTVAQKLLGHQMRPVPSVRANRPEVPRKMAAVLEKMLAKEPADRYQTPGDVAAALEPWTRTPIAPPTDDELHRLSPAARCDTSWRPDRRSTNRRVSPTTEGSEVCVLDAPALSAFLGAAGASDTIESAAAQTPRDPLFLPRTMNGMPPPAQATDAPASRVARWTTAARQRWTRFLRRLSRKAP
jgi:serine/threonine protein kinase